MNTAKEEELFDKLFSKKISFEGLNQHEIFKQIREIYPDDAFVFFIRDDIENDIALSIKRFVEETNYTNIGPFIAYPKIFVQNHKKISITPFKTIKAGRVIFYWEGIKFEYIIAPYHYRGLFRGFSDSVAFLITKEKMNIEKFIQFCYNKAKNTYDKTESHFYTNSGWTSDILPQMDLEWLVCSETVEAIMKDVKIFLKSENLYKKHKVPWQRGIILTGEPGNGKSALIRKITNDFNVPVLQTKGNFENKFDLGHMLHSVPISFRPRIVVLEDVDSLICEHNRSNFLNALDGAVAANNHGTFFIATTNYLEKIDPALKDRPSRFDRVFVLKNPESSHRLTYFKKWFKGKTLKKFTESDINFFIKKTDGFSYAQLKEVCLSTSLKMVSGRGRNISELLQESLSIIRKEPIGFYIL